MRDSGPLTEGISIYSGTTTGCSPAWVLTEKVQFWHGHHNKQDNLSGAELRETPSWVQCIFFSFFFFLVITDFLFICSFHVCEEKLMLNTIFWIFSSFLRMLDLTAQILSCWSRISCSSSTSSAFSGSTALSVILSRKQEGHPAVNTTPNTHATRQSNQCSWDWTWK